MRQNRDFRILWTANTVSSLGSQITLLALPLTAIGLLHASPMQMGILTACGTLPYLVFGLPTGAWVDRLRRRPLLIVADAGRAALLALIPLLYLLGWLRIEHLYLLAFLAGALSFLYDVTEEAYLATLVERDELVEGNSRLAAIDSMAELTSPVIAGGLVHLLTAPVAIAVDAASFLWSALWLSRIRQQETAPAPAGSGPLWPEIREGMAYLLRNPLLRAPLLTDIQWQLFGGMNDALLLLYLAETLHLSPTVIGLVFAASSVSALAMTRWNDMLARRLGPGPAAIGGALLLGAGWLLVPLANSVTGAGLGIVVTGMLLAGAGNVLWNVTTTSLAQTVTPNQLLGRVNASSRFLACGALPLGSLIGGWLAQQWGTRPALLLSCSGILIGVLWVWWSPLRSLARFPAESTDDLPVALD